MSSCEDWRWSLLSLSEREGKGRKKELVLVKERVLHLGVRAGMYVGSREREGNEGKRAQGKSEGEKERKNREGQEHGQRRRRRRVL